MPPVSVCRRRRNPRRQRFTLSPRIARIAGRRVTAMMTAIATTTMAAIPMLEKITLSTRNMPLMASALSLAIGPLVAPDGSVLGLDLSGPMLETATARADNAGLTNVKFERGDAQVHALPEAGFDGIVSRFGGMFFDDPHAAFANLARALRSRGRPAFAC